MGANEAVEAGDKDLFAVRGGKLSVGGRHVELGVRWDCEWVSCLQERMNDGLRGGRGESGEKEGMTDHI